jgi:hypothetical protein
MKSYGYDVITIGESELRLGEALVRSLAEDPSTPFVSANFHDVRAGRLLFPKTRVVEKGGVRVGVTAVTVPGVGSQPSVEDSGFQILDPKEVLPNVLRELRRKADIVVLIARMSSRDARALGEHFRGMIDVVIVGDGEPGRGVVHPENGGSVYITSGNRGQALGVTRIALVENRIDRITGDEFVLSRDYPEKPEVLSVIEDFQANLNALMKKASVNETVSRAAPDGHYYLTATNCADCHQQEFTIWQETPHAHAFETLVQAGMESLPECYQCHVTGHGDPAGYAPARRGAAELVNVQCEVCHDKGSRHSRNGDYGRSLLMNSCIQCHDSGNSPDFDPEVYWRMIEH